MSGVRGGAARNRRPKVQLFRKLRVAGMRCKRKVAPGKARHFSSRVSTQRDAGASADPSADIDR